MHWFCQKLRSVCTDNDHSVCSNCKVHRSAWGRCKTAASQHFVCSWSQNCAISIRTYNDSSFPSVAAYPGLILGLTNIQRPQDNKFSSCKTCCSWLSTSFATSASWKIFARRFSKQDLHKGIFTERFSQRGFHKDIFIVQVCCFALTSPHYKNSSPHVTTKSSSGVAGHRSLGL